MVVVSFLCVWGYDSEVETNVEYTDIVRLPKLNGLKL